MRPAGSLIFLAAAVVAPATLQAQTDSVFAVTRAGASLLRVNVNGNVGVGVSDPTQRLTVNGGVKADSATVSRVRFADGSSVVSMQIIPSAASYAAGWADNAIGYAPVTYYKDPAGVVHLQGMATYSGADSGQPLVLTLPEGYRPADVHLAMALANAGTVTNVIIGQNGTIQVQKTTGASFTSGNWVTFTGLQFLAAP